jgi:hypothetical protein
MAHPNQNENRLSNLFGEVFSIYQSEIPLGASVKKPPDRPWSVYFSCSGSVVCRDAFGGFCGAE